MGWLIFIGILSVFIFIGVRNDKITEKKNEEEYIEKHGTDGVIYKQAKAEIDRKYAIALANTNRDNKIANDVAKNKNIAYLKANNIAHCPKCSSPSVTSFKKGFSVGKAVVGGVLTGGNWNTCRGYWSK